MKKFGPQKLLIGGPSYQRGITLPGGGGLLRRLDKLIASEMDIHVQMSDDPVGRSGRGSRSSVAKGDPLNDWRAMW